MVTEADAELVMSRLDMQIDYWHYRHGMRIDRSRYEDAAMHGLELALKAWKPWRGKFPTYAFIRIEGALQKVRNPTSDRFEWRRWKENRDGKLHAIHIRPPNQYERLDILGRRPILATTDPPYGPAEPLISTLQTPRQREVATLFAEGYSAAEIHRELGISENRISKIRISIRQQLMGARLNRRHYNYTKIGPPAKMNLDAATIEKLQNPRERDVARLFSMGLNGVQVAKELGVSEEWVSQLRGKIRKQLQEAGYS